MMKHMLPFLLQWRSLLALGLWCAVLVNGAQAQVYTKGPTPWPIVPDPPRSNVESVTVDSRVNGVPTKIWRFESEAGQAEVESYYRSHWGAFDPTSSDRLAKGVLSARDSKGALLLSRFHGPFFITIKVNALGTKASTGLISVALTHPVQPAHDLHGLPVPPNATPLSVVESADGDRLSKLAHLLVSSDMQVLQAFFKSRAKEEGWTLLDVFQGDPAQGRSRQTALVFTRDNSELNVMISRKAGMNLSTVQINLIKPRT
jgi:hypothetical protein